MAAFDVKNLEMLYLEEASGGLPLNTASLSNESRGRQRSSTFSASPSQPLLNIQDQKWFSNNNGIINHNHMNHFQGEAFLTSFNMSQLSSNNENVCTNLSSQNPINKALYSKVVSRGLSNQNNTIQNVNSAMESSSSGGSSTSSSLLSLPSATASMGTWSGSSYSSLGLGSTSSTKRIGGRYKTELCRPYQENGNCQYAEKCQFAHGPTELRTVERHPKYKTDLCRTYHTQGFCPYGPRCHFIHSLEEVVSSPTGKAEKEITFTFPVQGAAYSAPATPLPAYSVSEDNMLNQLMGLDLEKTPLTARASTGQPHRNHLKSSGQSSSSSLSPGSHIDPEELAIATDDLTNLFLYEKFFTK